MATNDPIEFTEAELHALLRDETVPCASIAREMQDAGATPLPTEALELTRTFARAPDGAAATGLTGLAAPLRAFVIDAAITKQSVEFASALCASEDKTLVKEGKRIAHLLRTKGVKVEAPKAAPAPVAAAPVADELAVYMAAPDGFGDRVFFIPCAVKGGVDIVQISVHDEHGVVTASLTPVGRREYRKFIEKMRGTKLLLGEVPRSYARGLIAKGLDDNSRSGRAVPRGYNEVAFALGPVTDLEPSPGRTLPVPEDAPAKAATDASITDLPLFEHWYPAEDASSALGKRFDEITRSTLYPEDADKAVARGEAVRQAVAAYWTPARRKRYAERIFDLAWLEQKGNPETATRVLCVAHALDSDIPVEAIAFAFALFDKLARELGKSRQAPEKQRMLPGLFDR